MRFQRFICPVADRLLRNSQLLASTSGASSLLAGFSAFPEAEVATKANHYEVQPETAQLRACKGFKEGGFEVTHFPIERVRNFSIIAHIDHGKSTLADRLMEMTGAIPEGGKSQYLDKLQVERERGITVKAQTASLVYRYREEDYLLNLIDTPGHVDFSYEVSRSLAAVSGALLLVDAAQGIQAQTVANFFLAFEQSLAIVPVLNKCDMASAAPDKVAQQMQQVFDIEPSSCLRVSAKTGEGLSQILPAIIDQLPPPSGNTNSDLRILLFDAVHDDYRGVICLVHIVDGEVFKNDRVTAMSSGDTHEVLEVGVLVPEPQATGRLCTGQVGYIITGIKTVKSARIGDTWHRHKRPVQPLPGFRPSKSMVFAVHRENSTALGAGFRCGFLGLLHMEVFHQRLENEHGASVIYTPPTVPYKLEFADGDTLAIQNPSQFPLGRKLMAAWEPTVNATIVTPTEHVGGLMTLCQNHRGELKEHAVLGPARTLLKYCLPLAELGGSFYDDLKSASSGYASFDYEEGELRIADLVRLDLLVNGESVDALARIVHRDKAQRAGRVLCAQMKELMERQMYEIVIQASANGKIVARETLKAFRKNVLAKCYGGDVSRKRKLLEKQKEGKKRLARLGGGVEVPKEVFHALIKTAC